MSSEITPPHPTGPGTFAEGDSNQLEAQETLDDRGVDDTLDEGYTPPERDRKNHYGETDWEQSAGEPFDLRLAQEEPEVWDAPEKGAREIDRAGRLTMDAGAEQGRANDIFVRDVGIDGGAASAEEAAVHVVDEDDVPGLTDRDADDQQDDLVENDDEQR